MHWIDPDCLPETRGTVTRFLLNPHGELDGFILDDSRQVHWPPHLSRQLTRNVKVGDAVTVRGIKPRGADMVAAVAVTTNAGRTIVDEGPEHGGKHHPPEIQQREMEAAGEVLLALHGPKGELRGAFLDDGTSLRMPPHAAEALSDYLTPGAHVHAWGWGVKNRLGRSIEVDEIAHLVDDESAES